MGWGLLALWALVFFGGFIFGKPHAEGRHRMPTLTRMGASAVLVGFAWAANVLFSPPQPLGVWLAVGMTFGFLGDLFMARILRWGTYPLMGIGAFGVGHIAYIYGLWVSRVQLGLPAVMWVWALWLAVGLAGWFLVVYRPAKARTLIHGVALPYALLLASTVASGHLLALSQPLFIPLTIGAFLFLLSDLLLAAELFNGLFFPLIGDVVWLLYSPAQALIVSVTALMAYMAG